MWTEIAKRYQRFAAGVLEDHALTGRIVGDEHFILGQLAKADHGRRLQRQFSDPAAALHGDQTIGTVVLDRDFHAGIDGKLLGAKQLLTLDLAVTIQRST